RIRLTHCVEIYPSACNVSPIDGAVTAAVLVDQPLREFCVCLGVAHRTTLLKPRCDPLGRIGSVLWAGCPLSRPLARRCASMTPPAGARLPEPGDARE